MALSHHPLQQLDRSPWDTPLPAAADAIVPPGVVGLQNLALQVKYKVVASVRPHPDVVDHHIAVVPHRLLSTLQGRWQEAASRCRSSPPGEIHPLQLQAYHVLSLMKLKVYQDAVAQLDATPPPEARWPFALR
jgi:hypothetical protein